MNKIAHIFSWILSPVLIPTYAVFVALWVTLLSFLPVDARWGVVAMTWVITCAIPVVAILLLYKFKVISAPGLNQQKERYIPYVVTALCYLGCGLYMYRAHAPMWLVMFMVGGAAAAFVSCFINIWWKISAHGAAMGGLLALSDERIAARFAEFKKGLANKIVKANAELAEIKYKFKTNYP